MTKEVKTTKDAQGNVITVQTTEIEDVPQVKVIETSTDAVTGDVTQTQTTGAKTTTDPNVVPAVSETPVMGGVLEGEPGPPGETAEDLRKRWQGRK